MHSNIDENIVNNIKNNSTFLWKTQVFDKKKYCNNNEEVNKIKAYLRKIDYCLADIFYELHLTDRRNLILITMYLDIIRSATKLIRGIVKPNFNNPKGKGPNFEELDSFVSILRTAVYAHPLNIDGKSYTKLEYPVEKSRYVCIDISNGPDSIMYKLHNCCLENIQQNSKDKMKDLTNNDKVRYRYLCRKGIKQYDGEEVDYWISAYDTTNNFNRRIVAWGYIGISVNEILATVSDYILFLITLNNDIIEEKNKTRGNSSNIK